MDIGSMILVGALVTVFVQLIKKQFGTSSTYTYLIVIGISLLAGVVYVLYKDSSWWQNALQVLLAAGGIYTYILKQFSPN